MSENGIADSYGGTRSTLWRKEPTHPRQIRTNESYFNWVEDTDDPKFDEIRGRISSLWLRVPVEHRAEYGARLRSGRDSDFFSVYSELWYHHALEAGGLACAPAASTPAGSLPDWQIYLGRDAVALAECYLRMQSDTALRDEMVQRRWFDTTFAKLKNKRIRLAVHELQRGAGQPSAQRLAKELDRIASSWAVEEDDSSAQFLGRHQYIDRQSGWELEFTLIVRGGESAEGVQQLLYSQVDGASWCRGRELLKRALAAKSRQHSVATPIIICMAWNYFEHEPEFEDVCEIVASKACSLEKRGVYGVFWARSIYPWNPAPGAPRLLHWDATEVCRVVAAWSGETINVVS